MPIIAHASMVCQVKYGYYNVMMGANPTLPSNEIGLIAASKKTGFVWDCDGGVNVCCFGETDKNIYFNFFIDNDYPLL